MNARLPSFGLGVASGLVILGIAVFGLHLGATSGTAAAAGQGRAPNTARMAQRFGMTPADLQKELDSGKTIQQIAQEHGVTFGGGRGSGGGGASGGGGGFGGATASVQGNGAAASQ